MKTKQRQIYDGRPRKKVRFASEAGNNRIYARQDTNTGKTEKTNPQGSDVKTTEFQFFKKLWEQSGCRSRSFRLPHQNIEPNISKQKEGARMESHNLTSHRMVPVQKVTLCSNETPATPSNKEISDGKVNLQASHSEYDNHDTPQLNPRDTLPTIHVFTPKIQTPFEVAGISRNTGERFLISRYKYIVLDANPLISTCGELLIDIEPGGGGIFSEKRRKLLKLAAKTVSVESSELLQRRSEFFTEILQRLGGNNIIRKHHKELMRRRKMVSGYTPAEPGGHFGNMLDYRLSDFNSLTQLRTGKESSSSRDESRQILALPWVDDQGLPSFLDWKNDLPCGGNDSHDCMPLPSAYAADLSSSDWKRDTVHNQVSNLFLEDVEPCTKGRLVSANELGCNIQTGQYDHHGWDPMLSITFTESIPNRLSFPCQIEEQCVVPYQISNTFWQHDLCSSLEHCTSRSVGLEGEDSIEAGLFDNSDAGLLSRFDQLRDKCTSSSFLDLRNGMLDHDGFNGISNFHVSESSNVVSNPNISCLNSDYPFDLGSKRLCDSAVRISCLSGMEEEHSTEPEQFDNSDTGLAQELDQIPVKFTASSFSKFTSGILDHHHNPKDINSILSLDGDDTCLNSLSSSYSEHPCKQDLESLCEFSTELWSSAHHVQSHGAGLGAMLGFSSNGSIHNDFEDQSITLVEGSPKIGLFGTSDLSLFGSCSTMDCIREIPMLCLDGVRW